MEITKTPLRDLLIIKPDVFHDDRGYFFVPYDKKKYSDIGVKDLVQDNQSLSRIDVLRGLHFQAPPFAQGKLVRVVKGAVLDIAVDLRKESKTYGKYFSVELSEENMNQFWIPEGFAHGFVTLMDNTIFEYKCTNYYNKESEGGIIWNDKDLNIKWGVSSPIVSDKDLMFIDFKSFISPF